jgi:Asp-tRNA(Asn)/Glu-tRNA(Gln) amidotransferase A subunit family amidase
MGNRSTAGKEYQEIDQLEIDFDRRQSQILAFLPELGRFERLRREAQHLISVFPSQAVRPPLFGAVVGVKDMIHVEGFPTRAGSHLPAEVLQGPQAECITRLRRAGALILGKTHTSEFAYSAPTPTCNPHHPEHTPGGSSSGSAAAVAAGLCPIAMGTQTTGSIIRPAAFCGVVGFKPSYDRISRSGVIPLAPSIDHLGFFTISVTDAIRVASLLCDDWQPRDLPRSKPVLGVPEGPYLERVTDEGKAHFESVCQRLVLAGFEIEFVPAMHDFDAIAARHNLLLSAEAALVHAEWFAAYGTRYHPQTAQMIRRGKQIDTSSLTRARDGRERLRAELMTLMGAFGLDLWLSPAAPGPAPRGLDYTGDAIMNLPWSHSGLPAVSLPAGTNSAGLPLGLQVAARWYADEALLIWSLALERALQD